MARSNGPFGPAGTRPQARRHPGDDAFAPPPSGQPNGHWPPAHPAPAPQQGQGYHFPPEPDANYGYQQQQPAPFDGYQGGQQHDPYAPQQWNQQPDPRGYDLGNYMPNGSQQAYPPADPPPFAQGAHHDPYAQQNYADPEAEYEDEFVEEEEGTGRGRRWMFIVAALVGAVGVGGALAYTYKSFVAPNGGRVPLVKADPNVKVRPDTRNATNDKRMQGRLGEDAGQQNTATAPETQDERSGSDEWAVRAACGRFPLRQGEALRPASRSRLPRRPQRSAHHSWHHARHAKVPAAATASGAPAAATTGDHRSTTSTSRAAGRGTGCARRAPAPPPQVAKAPTAPKAAPPPPAANAAANTGAGFVAVLSSQKTRMDALKAFADLQQKYGEALSGRVPDVQEADLGDKGIWYRVVVGPPGSRNAANGVCSQLKSAGYSSCWVNAY